MHFRLDFIMEANTKGARELSDLGPYCLKYSLPKYMNRHGADNKLVTGGKKLIATIQVIIKCCMSLSPKKVARLCHPRKLYVCVPQESCMSVSPKKVVCLCHPR